jgi:hypothetical protein
VYHTLKVLTAVESLLLLEEEGVADEWETPNSLAVVRIWPWNTFVVGVVRSVIGSLSGAFVSADLRYHVRLIKLLANESGLGKLQHSQDLRWQTGSGRCGCHPRQQTEPSGQLH